MKGGGGNTISQSLSQAAKRGLLGPGTGLWTVAFLAVGTEGNCTESINQFAIGEDLQWGSGSQQPELQ